MELVLSEEFYKKRLDDDPVEDFAAGNPESPDESETALVPDEQVQDK